jgi:integrase/recombinase XerD
MQERSTQNLSLYSQTGERKYLNRVERRRALEVMARMAGDGEKNGYCEAESPPKLEERRRKRERALFSLLLAWTGGRVSEVLAVRANSFQLDRNVVALRTLKRRRHHVREIPISPRLMQALDRHFDLATRQRDAERANQRLWSWSSRVTAWRFIKDALLEAGVVGRLACPRGLRHGYAVTALQASVPLNLVQRWLGHARIATTAIYASACGDEEAAFAARLWVDRGKSQTALGSIWTMVRPARN